MGHSTIWSDPEAPKYEARWVGTLGKYLARGDRGLAWRGAIDSPTPWSFQPDGSSDVYLCFPHHIVLVNELLYGVIGASDKYNTPTQAGC